MAFAESPSVQEQRELLNALLQELAAFEEVLRGLDQGMYQRAMIRMAFSFLDSLLNTLENYLLCILATSEVKYEKSLQEVDGACQVLGAKKNDGGVWDFRNVTLDDKIDGLKKLSRFLDTEGALKGKKLAHILSAKPRNFKFVKKVRDEITHPKTLSSLQVSPDALMGLGNLISWMMDLLREVVSTTYQEELRLTFGHTSSVILNSLISMWLEGPISRPPAGKSRLPDLPAFYPSQK